MELTKKDEMILDFCKNIEGWFWNKGYIKDVVYCKKDRYDNNSCSGNFPFIAMTGDCYECFSLKKPKPEIVKGDWISIGKKLIRNVGNIEAYTLYFVGGDSKCETNCTRLPQELQDGLNEYFNSVGEG